MKRISNLDAGERGKRVFNIQIFDVDIKTGRNEKAVSLPVYAKNDDYPTKEDLREFIKNSINKAQKT